jgi:signal transduction histidine kinase
VALFYQTKAFLIACLIASGVSGRVLYVMRLKYFVRQIRLNIEASAIERDRAARELHDSLLQGMQGLVYKMSAIAERFPEEDPNRLAMETVLDQAESMLIEVRDQFTGVRRTNPATDSLADALGAAAKDLQLLSKSEVRISVQGVARELKSLVREELYRIGAEALVNASRYAAAAFIEVEILYDETALSLRIRDDGRGFDGESLRKLSQPGHFGLIALQERAIKIGGSLEIWSREGAGTEVSCRVDADQAYVGRKPSRLLDWIRRIWTIDGRRN